MTVGFLKILSLQKCHVDPWEPFWFFLIGINFNGFSHIEQPTPGGHWEKYGS